MDDTVFATHTAVHMRGFVGEVEYGGGDRGMVCLFYNHKVKDPQRSIETGRPFFKDVPYARIAPPGERLNVWDGPVREDHKRRWPREWALFLQNKEQVPDGTPVDILYPEHPSIAGTLRGWNVHTVEQLAELSANAIETIGIGAQQWVNYARDFLAKANKGVTMTQFRKEKEEMQRENRVLQQQLDLVKAELARLQSGSLGQATLDDLQAQIEALKGRPQVTAQRRGGVDPQLQMINNTSPTHEVTQQRRVSRRKKA